MENLTFGEQVKIILSRKGMTIKELSEQIESRTGKNMSRQNMTQRLKRDNFQEKDMRMIAEILGCSFQLSIMEQTERAEQMKRVEQAEREDRAEQMKRVEQVVEKGAGARDITVGELVKMSEELQLEPVTRPVEEPLKEIPKKEERKTGFSGIRGYMRKPKFRTPDTKKETDTNDSEPPILGEINPYTGKEYQTNSVRMHPKRIGYVQVYDQSQHKWTDMTEWAFLGYQERKKALLGKDYDPPIYLD